jgi:glycosyltransferase involved in cell wall biosynthesis
LLHFAADYFNKITAFLKFNPMITVTQDKRHPRLLQMMLSTQPGGAENFFEKLSLALADAGVPQCLVVEPNEARAKLYANYPHVELIQIRFGGLREFFAQRRLREVFRRFQPDVALTWMNRASRRVPAGYCPVVGRLGGYYKLKNYKNCDQLIGITPNLVDHITSGGWEAERVCLIPNFGETAQMRTGDADGAALRESLGISASDTVLLALGRLHEVKAHDTLIRALANVNEATLLLAGEGPLESDLRELAAKLGVAERIHFLGWRRDVARLFDACDISVFPSRYEPNGTVVMESWAHQRPLIASRAKGPEWLVDDGRNGLLFDIDSVDQLTKKIELLQRDAELSKSLVANGISKWEAGFSKDAVVQQYLGLFDALCARRG